MAVAGHAHFVQRTRLVDRQQWVAAVVDDLVCRDPQETDEDTLKQRELVEVRQEAQRVAERPRGAVRLLLTGAPLVEVQLAIPGDALVVVVAGGPVRLGLRDIAGVSVAAFTARRPSGAVGVGATVAALPFPTDPGLAHRVGRALPAEQPLGTHAPLVARVAREAIVAVPVVTATAIASDAEPACAVSVDVAGLDLARAAGRDAQITAARAAPAAQSVAFVRLAVAVLRARHAGVTTQQADAVEEVTELPRWAVRVLEAAALVVVGIAPPRALQVVDAAGPWRLAASVRAQADARHERRERSEPLGVGRTHFTCRALGVVAAPALPGLGVAHVGAALARMDAPLPDLLRARAIAEVVRDGAAIVGVGEPIGDRRVDAGPLVARALLAGRAVVAQVRRADLVAGRGRHVGGIVDDDLVTAAPLVALVARGTDDVPTIGEVAGGDGRAVRRHTRLVAPGSPEAGDACGAGDVRGVRLGAGDRPVAGLLDALQAAGRAREPGGAPGARDRRASQGVAHVHLDAVALHRASALTPRAPEAGRATALVPVRRHGADRARPAVDARVRGARQVVLTGQRGRIRRPRGAAAVHRDDPKRGQRPGPAGPRGRHGAERQARRAGRHRRDRHERSRRSAQPPEGQRRRARSRVEVQGPTDGSAGRDRVHDDPRVRRTGHDRRRDQRCARRRAVDPSRVGRPIARVSDTRHVRRLTVGELQQAVAEQRAGVAEIQALLTVHRPADRGARRSAGVGDARARRGEPADPGPGRRAGHALRDAGRSHEPGVTHQMASAQVVGARPAPVRLRSGLVARRDLDLAGVSLEAEQAGAGKAAEAVRAGPAVQARAVGALVNVGAGRRGGVAGPGHTGAAEVEEPRGVQAEARARRDRNPHLDRPGSGAECGRHVVQLVELAERHGRRDPPRPVEDLDQRADRPGGRVPARVEDQRHLHAGARGRPAVRGEQDRGARVGGRAQQGVQRDAPGRPDFGRRGQQRVAPRRAPGRRDELEVAQQVAPSAQLAHEGQRLRGEAVRASQGAGRPRAQDVGAAVGAAARGGGGGAPVHRTHRAQLDGLPQAVGLTYDRGGRAPGRMTPGVTDGHALGAQRAPVAGPGAALRILHAAAVDRLGAGRAPVALHAEARRPADLVDTGPAVEAGIVQRALVDVDLALGARVARTAGADPGPVAARAQRADPDAITRGAGRPEGPGRAGTGEAARPVGTGPLTTGSAGAVVAVDGTAAIVAVVPGSAVSVLDTHGSAGASRRAAKGSARWLVRPGGERAAAALVRGEVTGEACRAAHGIAAEAIDAVSAGARGAVAAGLPEHQPAAVRDGAGQLEVRAEGAVADPERRAERPYVGGQRRAHDQPGLGGAEAGERQGLGQGHEVRCAQELEAEPVGGVGIVGVQERLQGLTEGAGDRRGAGLGVGDAVVGQIRAEHRDEEGRATGADEHVIDGDPQRRDRVVAVHADAELELRLHGHPSGQLEGADSAPRVRQVHHPDDRGDPEVTRHVGGQDREAVGSGRGRPLELELHREGLRRRVHRRSTVDDADLPHRRVAHRVFVRAEVTGRRRLPAARACGAPRGVGVRPQRGRAHHGGDAAPDGALGAALTALARRARARVAVQVRAVCVLGTAPGTRDGHVLAGLVREAHVEGARVPVVAVAVDRTARRVRHLDAAAARDAGPLEAGGRSVRAWTTLGQELGLVRADGAAARSRGARTPQGVGRHNAVFLERAGRTDSTSRARSSELSEPGDGRARAV